MKCQEQSSGSSGETQAAMRSEFRTLRLKLPRNNFLANPQRQQGNPLLALRAANSFDLCLLGSLMPTRGQAVANAGTVIRRKPIYGGQYFAPVLNCPQRSGRAPRGIGEGLQYIVEVGE